MPDAALMIVSDLDGTLLDHHSYDFSPALPLMTALQSQGVAVVFCTSKTFPEVIHLRRSMNNRSAFIVENGAGIYLPKSEFPIAPAGVEDRGEFWCRSFCPPRRHWLQLLQQAKPRFGHCFQNFAAMSVEQVQQLTGLTAAAAARAQQREFGEPLDWLGSDEELTEFTQWCQAQDATILSGGRFVHIAGDADKGQALNWLASTTKEVQPAQTRVTTIALGDSANDVAMLEQADYAVCVRSPVKDFPSLASTTKAYQTVGTGPVGWVEGIEYWLSTLNISFNTQESIRG